MSVLRRRATKPSRRRVELSQAESRSTHDRRSVSIVSFRPVLAVSLRPTRFHPDCRKPFGRIEPPAHPNRPVSVSHATQRVTSASRLSVISISWEVNSLQETHSRRISVLPASLGAPSASATTRSPLSLRPCWYSPGAKRTASPAPTVTRSMPISAPLAASPSPAASPSSAVSPPLAAAQSLAAVSPAAVSSPAGASPPAFAPSSPAGFSIAPVSKTAVPSTT